MRHVSKRCSSSSTIGHNEYLVEERKKPRICIGGKVWVGSAFHRVRYEVMKGRHFRAALLHGLSITSGRCKIALNTSVSVIRLDFFSGYVKATRNQNEKMFG